MLKFSVRHVMIVVKIHERISSKQREWLWKNIGFTFQKIKMNQVVNDFEKVFYTLPFIALYGKTMKNVRGRLKVEFLKKRDNEKII